MLFNINGMFLRGTRKVVRLHVVLINLLCAFIGAHYILYREEDVLNAR